MLFSFLLLFASLFTGYGMQSPYTFKDSNNVPSIENFEKSQHADFGTSQNILVLVSKFEITQFYKEKPRPKYKLRATDIEEEEEELPSAKKSVKNTNYFTSVFNTQSREYLYHNSKNTTAFCKQLSFILSNKRYVFFHVFRI